MHSPIPAWISGSISVKFRNNYVLIDHQFPKSGMEVCCPLRGHSRPSHSAPAPVNVRYASNSDRSRHWSELTLSANRRHSHRSKIQRDSVEQISDWERHVSGST
jgi:hypothetical protein